MAVAYRDSGAISSGVGARSPAMSASHASDDIDILFVETTTAEDATLSTAAGFAELLELDEGSGTRLTVFWRRWDGVAGLPTVADAGNHVICRVNHYTGCITSGDPWDVFGSNSQSATTSGSITEVTTTIDECGIVAISACEGPDANSTNEFGSWAEVNMVSIAETTDDTRNSGDGGALGTAFGIMSSAGATGAVTFASVETTVKANCLIALKPPVVGGSSGAGWWGSGAGW